MENEKWDYVVKNSKKQPKKPIGFVMAMLFFCVCLAMVISGVYAAQQQNVGTEFVIEYLGPYGFTLNSDEASYTLAEFKAKDKEGFVANIPATYNELPVTAIAAYVFRDSKISSVNIPENITDIGNWAFYNCTELTEVSIPTSLSRIGNSSYWPPFAGCNSLTTVKYPGDLKQWCESSCTGLTYLLGAGRDLYLQGKKVEGNLVITDDITKINDGAFYYIDDITSLKIGSNVTSIGFSAFSNCIGLTGSLNIPASVESIGSGAFSNCSALTGTVVIPENVTVINSSTFADCSNLTLVKIPENVTEIGQSAFSGCESLTEITIPAKVNRISTYAFEGCVNLTKINYNAENVTYYPSYESRYPYEPPFTNAGQSGPGITLTIGDNVTTIPHDFLYSYYAPKITNIKMGNSVKSIGDYAFRGCPYITSITIPETVTSIGKNAFSGMSTLTAINFNAINITSWPQQESSVNKFNPFNRAGSSSNGITLTIGNRVTKLPSNMFYTYDSSNTANITELIMGSAVEYIGDYAFYNCSGIPSLTIPEKVTTIGEYAFVGLTNLTSLNYNAINITSYPEKERSSTSARFNPFNGVGKYGEGIAMTIGNAVTNIPANLFYTYASTSAPNISSIAMGNSVENIGENAFYSLSKITKIQVPATMQVINNEAFYGCTNLKEVTNKSNLDIVAGKSDNGYVAFYADKVIEKDGTITPLSPFIFTFVEDHYEVKARNKTITSGALEIPSNYRGSPVTAIVEKAFYDYSEITSIKIPSSITSIGASAFHNCSGLTAIAIPEKVASIGAFAFDYCTGLQEITIPESVTLLGQGAFYKCKGLTKINYNANFAGDYSSNQAGVFTDAGTSGTGIALIIGNNVTHIPGRLCAPGSDSTTDFLHPNITSITIGTGVETIGDKAFVDLYKLTQINYNATKVEDLTTLSTPFRSAGISGAGVTVIVGGNVTYIPKYLCYMGENSTLGKPPKITNVIIDSADIYKAVSSSRESIGRLTNYITSGGTIKVLQAVDNNTNTYLNSSIFTKSSATISGKQYNVYTRV